MAEGMDAMIRLSRELESIKITLDCLQSVLKARISALELEIEVSYFL